MLLPGFHDKAVRMAMIMAYEGRCRYCGNKHKKEQLVLEHIFPASKGGKNELENYTLACRRCNSLKSNEILPEAGRILLTTVAKRKIPRILKILEGLEQKKNFTSKTTLKQKTRGPLESPREEKKLGEFVLSCASPINYLALQLFLGSLNHPSLKSTMSSCEMFLDRTDILQICQTFNTTEREIRAGLKWLCQTMINGPGGEHNLINRVSIIGVDDLIHKIQFSFFNPPKKFESALQDIAFNN